MYSPKAALLTISTCGLLRLVVASGGFAMTVLEASDNSTHIVAGEFGRLAVVKLGVAVAMFVSVLIACGLPILVMTCLHRRTVSASSITPLAGAVRSGVENSTAGNSSSSSAEISGDSSAPPPVGTSTIHRNNTVESRQLLIEQTSLEDQQVPVSPNHPYDTKWSTNSAGTLIPSSVDLKAMRRRTLLRRQWVIQMWASRITCFAAGVFLSTGFMDLFPDVEEAVTAALSRFDRHIEYPLAAFFTLVGFFFVLLVEQTVLVCHRRQQHRHHCNHTYSRPPLSSDLISNENGDVVHSNHEASPITATHQMQHEEVYEHVEHGHSHLPTNGSMLRVFLLLIALSVHSVFEGLAVGLQRTVAEVVALFSALMLHKLIMAASIGVSLAMSRRPSDNDLDMSQPSSNVPNKKTTHTHIACTLIFALASPSGVLVGCGLIAQRSSGILLMVIAVLQGLACGTFFFVVFCEMLPNEFKEGATDRVVKFLFLIVGFAVVALYILFEPE